MSFFTFIVFVTLPRPVVLLFVLCQPFGRFFTSFSKSLPLEAASRVWDVFFRDGDEFLFRTGLGKAATVLCIRDWLSICFLSLFWKCICETNASDECLDLEPVLVLRLIERQEVVKLFDKLFLCNGTAHPVEFLWNEDFFNCKLSTAN